MSDSDHICTVCAGSMFDHDSRCGLRDKADGGRPCTHLPPVCCPGCPCKSFEESHARFKIGQTVRTPISRRRGKILDIRFDEDAERVVYDLRMAPTTGSLATEATRGLRATETTLGEDDLEDVPVQVRLSRYTRGTRAIAGFNTPMVGYRVYCTCGQFGGDGQRNNAPKRETLRDVVKPHLREAHGLRGQAAERVVW